MPMQAKLLRAVQEREIQRVGSDTVQSVDVRILAATNRSLKDEVDAGRFREDLYYRLHVMALRLPALRERQDDVPLLANFFLERFAEKNRKAVKGFTPLAMDMLIHHGWPGNVRELENVLERSLILARSDTLGPDLLPPMITGAAAPAPEMEPPQHQSPASLEEAEKLAIIRALEENGGHRERTADALGVSRRTLQYKLKKFGLTRRA